MNSTHMQARTYESKNVESTKVSKLNKLPFTCVFLFELLYWRKSNRKFHGKPVPISVESWAFYLIISSVRFNMSSLIVCRILASNYQANNHYNRAGAKCPIFLVMVKVKCIFVMYHLTLLPLERRYSRVFYYSLFMSELLSHSIKRVKYVLIHHRKI